MATTTILPEHVLTALIRSVRRSPTPAADLEILRGAGFDPRNRRSHRAALVAYARVDLPAIVAARLVADRFPA